MMGRCLMVLTKVLMLIDYQLFQLLLKCSIFTALMNSNIHSVWGFNFFLYIVNYIDQDHQKLLALESGP